MNERIKQLAEQAGFAKLNCGEFSAAESDRIERFAELVRQSEREACAKLVEEVGKQTATAIRARGNT